MGRPSAVQLLERAGYELKPKHGKQNETIGYIVNNRTGNGCPVCRVRFNEYKEHKDNPTQTIVFETHSLDSRAVQCIGHGGYITYRELAELLGHDPETLTDGVPHKKKEYSLAQFAKDRGFPAEGIEAAPVYLDWYIKANNEKSKTIRTLVFKWPSGALHANIIQKPKDPEIKLKKAYWIGGQSSEDVTLWYWRNPNTPNLDPEGVYIAEGCKDALALGQLGFDAIGVPGAHRLTAGNLKWLREKFPNKQCFYLCFDADDGGKAGTNKARDLLALVPDYPFKALFWPPELLEEEYDICKLTKAYGNNAAKMLIESGWMKSPFAELVNETPVLPTVLKLYDGKVPEPNSFGVIRWFIDKHKDDVMYVCDLVKPPYYIWKPEQNKWYPDKNNVFVDQKSWESLRSLYDFANSREEKWWHKFASRLLNETSIREIRGLARSRPEIIKLSHELDNKPYHIPFRNGTYCVKTGSFAEPQKSYLNTRACPIDYIEEETCPKWLEFLSEIFDNDQALIDAMQILVGYCLTGYASEQSFYIFYGSGANGKSTFVEVIRLIAGPDYALQMESKHIMDSKIQSDHSSHLARLEGSRILTAKEPKERDRLDDSIVKTLADDTPLTARDLYASPREFPVTWTPILLTNHEPNLTGIDSAIRRRIILIPFTVVIPEENRNQNLKDELKAELSGIANWALEGARKWYNSHSKGKIAFPDSIKKATKEFFTRNDSVQMFIEDLCEAKAGFSVPFREFYEMYSTWCEVNSEYVLSGKKVGSRLKSLGKESTPQFISGIKLEDGSRGIKGLWLKPSDDPTMVAFMKTAEEVRHKADSKGKRQFGF